MLKKGRDRVQLGATGMCCGPAAAMESTSLLRAGTLLAGDTKEGEASTRDPDTRSSDGVVEPCAWGRARGAWVGM
jgi:hypothetical protein